MRLRECESESQEAWNQVFVELEEFGAPNKTSNLKLQMGS